MIKNLDQDPTKTYIIETAYRHPSDNINKFIENFS